MNVLFINYLVYLFNKHLLITRHCSEPYECNGEQDRHDLHPLGAHFVRSLNEDPGTPVIKVSVHARLSPNFAFASGDQKKEKLAYRSKREK